MDSEQIQREALALPEAARTELAHCLLQNGRPLSEERQAPELAGALSREDGRRDGEFRPVSGAGAMADLRKIRQAALALPEAARNELCRNLLVSLEPQEGLVSEEEAEASWLPEIRRRVAEIDRGEAQMIPHAEVMRKAREILKRGES